MGPFCIPSMKEIKIVKLKGSENWLRCKLLMEETSHVCYDIVEGDLAMAMTTGNSEKSKSTRRNEKTERKEISEVSSNIVGPVLVLEIQSNQE